MADKEPVPIRPAATVLLVRDTPVFQVLMVKRHHQIDFASGALVFPGGKTAPSDHDEAWAGHAIGWAETDADQRPFRIAALREIYEEAGILIARDAAGVHFTGDERAHDARGVVAKDDGMFMPLVRQLGVFVDLTELTVFARWITPDFTPKRFDTWFYVAKADSEQLAICDGWETVDAEWIAPAEALRLADAGQRTVIFPTRMNLKLLAEASSADDAIARAKARTLVTVLPKMERRGEARVLVIPPDAGYGAVEEPMERIGV
ncbi:MAG TPA: NUDIX hydrolase [Caulobacteraceae bacterium]|nr:NUDIX hydrolase [Caulobacteraceae bacterium]